MSIRSVFLWLLVMVSAVLVVTVRHHNRIAFVALQEVEAQKIELQSEWGRLMLEKATWSMHNNVADDARKRLVMAPPAPEKIVTLELQEE